MEKFARDSCQHAQFIADSRFVLLVVTQPAPDDMVSQFYICGIEPEAGIVRGDCLLEYDGWLTTFWRDPDERLFVGTSDGGLLINSGDGIQEFELGERGISRIVGSRPDHAFALSMDGSAHRWDGRTWADLGTGFSVPLFSIIEATDGSLYVCGGEGLLARLSDGRWRRIPVPTNCQLTALMERDGSIWVCGDRGVVFELRGESLRQWEAGSCNLFGFAPFRSDVYLAAAPEGVRRRGADAFEMFQAGVPAFGITSSRSYLLTYGDDELAAFDGSRWRTLTLD